LFNVRQACAVVPQGEGISTPNRHASGTLRPKGCWRRLNFGNHRRRQQRSITAGFASVMRFESAQHTRKKTANQKDSPQREFAGVPTGTRSYSDRKFNELNTGLTENDALTGARARTPPHFQRGARDARKALPTVLRSIDGFAERRSTPRVDHLVPTLEFVDSTDPRQWRLVHGGVGTCD
jgi:hypothetical protein